MSGLPMYPGIANKGLETRANTKDSESRYVENMSELNKGN